MPIILKINFFLSLIINEHKPKHRIIPYENPLLAKEVNVDFNSLIKEILETGSKKLKLGNMIKATEPSDNRMVNIYGIIFLNSLLSKK